MGEAVISVDVTADIRTVIDQKGTGPNQPEQLLCDYYVGVAVKCFALKIQIGVNEAQGVKSWSQFGWKTFTFRRKLVDMSPSKVQVSKNICPDFEVGQQDPLPHKPKVSRGVSVCPGCSVCAQGLVPSQS